MGMEWFNICGEMINYNGFAWFPPNPRTTRISTFIASGVGVGAACHFLFEILTQTAKTR